MKTRLALLKPAVAALAAIAVLLGAGLALAEELVTVKGHEIIAGPLSLFVPNDWNQREGPADDNPHFDAPGLNPGLGPSIAVAVEDNNGGAINPEDAGMKILSQSGKQIGAHVAQAEEWLFTEEDGHGITLTFNDVIPGKLVKISGWTAASEWEKKSPELWAVINSIEIADTGTEPIPPAEPGGLPMPEAPSGWTGWDMGGVFFHAPGDWSPFSSDPVALTIDLDSWQMELIQNHGATERGGVLVVSWGTEARGYSANIPAKSVIHSRRIDINGFAATAKEFKFTDAYNNTHGIDVVVDEPIGGKNLVLTCRGPAKAWASRYSTDCGQVLGSFAIRLLNGQ